MWDLPRPDQGSNPCRLHWQADSQPLRHQGKPSKHFLHLKLQPLPEILSDITLPSPKPYGSDKVSQSQGPLESGTPWEVPVNENPRTLHLRAALHAHLTPHTIQTPLMIPCQLNKGSLRAPGTSWHACWSERQIQKKVRQTSMVQSSAPGNYSPLGCSTHGQRYRYNPNYEAGWRRKIKILLKYSWFTMLC